VLVREKTSGKDVLFSLLVGGRRKSSKYSGMPTPIFVPSLHCSVQPRRYVWLFSRTTSVTIVFIPMYAKPWRV
jgi:hypothetical protein